MADDGPHPAPFCYLHLHTAYGPGGGPGRLADYVAAAATAGYPALACSDYGSLAAWPDWERACRQAGLHPLYGLTFDLQLDPAESADPWPLLALAATGTGLRHLVQIHNRLARSAEGPCVLSLAALPDLAAGLWLILLPAGEYGAAPLTNRPRPAVLAALDRLAARLPRRSNSCAVLLPDDIDQPYLAELAARIRPAHGRPAHRVLPGPRSGSAPRPAPPAPDPRDRKPAGAGSGDKLNPKSAIQNPKSHRVGGSVAARYAAQAEAWDLAGAVAASCHATLADLAGPVGLAQAGADAALADAVDEALAAAGRGRDPEIDAELSALQRQGWAGPLLAARRIVAAARAAGILLGAPGGVVGEGRVPALLGLAPADPFGAPPRWLDAPPQAPAWLPAISVPALRRDSLLAGLHEAGPAPQRDAPAPVLVPAGGREAQGPVAALAAIARALALPAATAAALGQALVAGRPSERAIRWRAAASNLPPATAHSLLDWVTALEALPGPPLADAEALLVLPPTPSCRCWRCRCARAPGRRLERGGLPGARRAGAAVARRYQPGPAATSSGTSRCATPSAARRRAAPRAGRWRPGRPALTACACRRPGRPGDHA